MKQRLLVCALAIVTACVGLQASPFKVTITPVGEKPTEPMKSISVSKADVIVCEDFSGFVDGDAEDVSTWGGDLCASSSTNAIDPELTHGVEWTGHEVHQAGGCVGLWNLNPLDPSYINTPKMDYSGSIVVTFLAKALYTEWEEENEYGEMTKMHFTNTSLMVCMGSDEGNNKFDYGTGIEVQENLELCPLYYNQGWCEVTIEFDNYSSYNDAYLCIGCKGHMLVDDVKITASVDNFIGEPVFKGITAADETSFTIAFEPVRKAFNYYTYLYELDGYDDLGNPIYKTVVIPESLFDEETLAYLAEMGMSAQEYLEWMAAEMGMTYDELLEELVYEKPYNNIGIVDHVEGQELYTYTYSGLDPEKEYYIDIRSHYYLTFSNENIRPVYVIGTPVNLDATDITDTGFTANWEKITKAEGYYIDLYGVNQAQEDEENFVIFEEDFDATESLTDATDINNPDVPSKGSDIVFDDLTSTPGWDFADEYILLVKGMAGLGVDWLGSFLLTSPKIYVYNADKAVVSLRVESTVSDFTFYLRFADKVYSIPVKGKIFEGDVELPTYGMVETTLGISGPNTAPIFIDYISISQSLKAGDYSYIWLGRNTTEADVLSYTYDNLDPDAFGFYAFCASAFKGEGNNQLVSLDAGRMIVDLASGESVFDLESNIEAIVDVVEVERYTLEGIRIYEPVPGINIIRYSDGSTRKVLVK
ncbi:MAG: hypothetical protein ACI31C_08540 [Muribaculaceae bacterium]